VANRRSRWRAAPLVGSFVRPSGTCSPSCSSSMRIQRNRLVQPKRMRPEDPTGTILDERRRDERQIRHRKEIMVKKKLLLFTLENRFFSDVVVGEQRRRLDLRLGSICGGQNEKRIEIDDRDDEVNKGGRRPIDQRMKSEDLQKTNERMNVSRCSTTKSSRSQGINSGNNAFPCVRPNKANRNN
jgi:hypothetical protein